MPGISQSSPKMAPGTILCDGKMPMLARDMKSKKSRVVHMSERICATNALVNSTTMPRARPKDLDAYGTAVCHLPIQSRFARTWKHSGKPMVACLLTSSILHSLEEAHEMAFLLRPAFDLTWNCTCTKALPYIVVNRHNTSKSRAFTAYAYSTPS